MNKITYLLLSILLISQIICLKKHITQETQETKENPQEYPQFLTLLFSQNPSFEKNLCLKSHLTNCANTFINSENSQNEEKQGIQFNTDDTNLSGQQQQQQQLQQQQKLIEQIKKLKIYQQQHLLDSKKLYLLNYKWQEDLETKDFWACADLTSENICQEELMTINFQDYAPFTTQFFIEQKNSHQQAGSPEYYDDQQYNFWDCLYDHYELCAKQNGMKILDYQEFSNFLTQLDQYVQANQPDLQQILEYSATLLNDQLPRRDFLSCISFAAMMQCDLFDAMGGSEGSANEMDFGF